MGIWCCAASARSVSPTPKRSIASLRSSAGNESIAMRRWSSSSVEWHRASASDSVTLFSRGWRVAFLIYFSMEFRIALAKYALG